MALFRYALVAAAGFYYGIYLDQTRDLPKLPAPHELPMIIAGKINEQLKKRGDK
jgi:hypothetical protein